MSRCALITGASGGIGYALAEEFAQHHYDLVLVARTKAKLDKAAQELKTRFGIHIMTIDADLSDQAQCLRVYERVQQAGQAIDVLVNNAGLGDGGLFVDSDVNKQQAMIALNCTAVTVLTRLFLPDLVKRRQGFILNVASTAAFQPGPLMSVYYATKAFVLSFSLAIGHELKGAGVTVTCLCPGPTATDFQVSAFKSPVRLTQGRKLPSPQQIARYGYKAMIKKIPVAVPGQINKLLTFVIRFLPRALVLHIVNFLQKSI